MSDNSKLLAGIVIGAAAGTVLTLLFNTEAGKQAVANIKSAADKVLRDWKDTSTPETAV